MSALVFWLWIVGVVLAVGVRIAVRRKTKIRKRPGDARSVRRSAG